MTNINKGYGISDIESGSSDMDVSSGEDDTVMTVDALKRDQVSDLGDEGVDLAPVSFTRKVGQHTSSQKVVSMQKPSYVTSVTSTQNTEAIIISDDDDDNLVAEAEDDEDSDRFFTPPSSPRLMDTRELARTSMTTTPTMAATNVGMTAAYWKEKKAQQELIDKLRQQVQEQGRENSKYRKLLDNQQKQQGEVQRQLSALEGQSAAAKTKMAEIQNKLNMAEHTLKDLNTTLLRLEVNLSMTKNKKKKPSKSATLAPSPIKKPDTKMSQNDIQQAKKEKGKRVETQPPPPPPPPGQQEQQEQEGQQQQQQQHLSHSQKKNRRKKARGKGKANTPSTDNPMISDNEVEGATNAPLTQHNATDGQRQSISMATLNIPDGSAMLPSKDDASIQGGPLTVA
ncbi:hypothetical protein BDF20DRAFT_990448, partial [Mycotypha africana]|uniref:uncharacterized protein n=1 Tax=Mycotypha africana TaxID=64632 RepID=UPI0022FFEFEC